MWAHMITYCFHRQYIKRADPFTCGWRVLQVVGHMMTRIVDQEIHRMPYVEQPGNYRIGKTMQWDQETLEQLNNIASFYSGEDEKLDIFNRYP